MLTILLPLPRIPLPEVSLHQVGSVILIDLHILMTPSFHDLLYLFFVSVFLFPCWQASLSLSLYVCPRV